MSDANNPASSHVDETQLEAYAMGTLPEQSTEAIEEHLLACVACQEQLLEMDHYVRAVRSVSPRLRAARTTPAWRQWFRIRPRTAWATACMAAGVALLAVLPWRPDTAGLPAVAVELSTTRGVDGLSLAQAPAGHPLILVVDLGELPALPRYHLEVVDETGSKLWAGEVRPAEGRIREAVPKSFASGIYFVRLSAGRELLREFSLQVR